MPPKRRTSDQLSVRVIGWLACLVLASSLTYTFVRALLHGTQGIDPLFFGMQTMASLLFLIYSIRINSRIFIAANSVALFNALGTLTVFALARW